MFKVLKKGCEPTRGTKYSACVDLFSSEDCVIRAGETKVIGLGVCIDLEKLIENSNGMFYSQSFDSNNGGWIDSQFNKELFDEFQASHYLQLMLRSSLGKKGLILPNGVGVIDLDYPDEIKLIVHNPAKVDTYETSLKTIRRELIMKEDYNIKKGDRIAQITMLEHKSYLFGIDTEVERTSGIGSTDEKI